MPNGEEHRVVVTKDLSVGFEHIGGDPRLAYLDDLVRYAYARLGSIEEAEDVAIEVLQAAVNVRGGLGSVREPKLYLLGIARRKVAEHHRKTRKQRGPGTLALDDLSLVAAQPFAADTSVAVREVLSKLPELYREVLLLKYIHGLSADEIAQVIGKSRTSARSLVQRAREAFAREGGHLVEERA
jgi:RNA polymerase sigma-70 factor (ECF subfamily)